MDKMKDLQIKRRFKNYLPNLVSDILKHLRAPLLLDVHYRL